MLPEFRRGLELELDLVELEVHVRHGVNGVVEAGVGIAGDDEAANLLRSLGEVAANPADVTEHLAYGHVTCL